MAANTFSSVVRLHDLQGRCLFLHANVVCKRGAGLKVGPNTVNIHLMSGSFYSRYGKHSKCRISDRTVHNFVPWCNFSFRNLSFTFVVSASWICNSAIYVVHCFVQIDFSVMCYCYNFAQIFIFDIQVFRIRSLPRERIRKREVLGRNLSPTSLWCDTNRIGKSACNNSSLPCEPGYRAVALQW